MAFALTDNVFQLSQRALDRAWPDLDATERQLKFIEIVYGATLAAGVAAHLRRER